jgi:hypothetical protein
MARKQILTNENIRTDIKNALKRPANPAHAEHHKEMLPLLVFSAILLAAMVIFQNYYKLILLIGLIFIAAYLIIDHLRKRNKINNNGLHRIFTFASHFLYLFKFEILFYVSF